MANDLSQQQLIELLDYHPDTGKFYWKPRRVESFSAGNKSQKANHQGWTTKYCGKEAFTSTNPYGYKQTNIGGLVFRAHRVAWCIVKGYWPEQIDHVNGDRADNRIDNLREVNDSENRKNMSRAKNNKSGQTGVFWDTARNLWRAEIKLNRVNRYIGRYKTFDEACMARKREEEKLGFHVGHGKEQVEQYFNPN